MSTKNKTEALGADLVPAMPIRANPVPDLQHCFVGLQQDLVTNSCLYVYRVYPNCCLLLIKNSN